MALSFDEIWVYGGQLIVAEPFTTPEALGKGTSKVNWSSFVQGPLQVGKVGAFNEATATTMIGRTDTIYTDRSLNVRGNVHVEGDNGTPWAFNLNGNQEIQGNDQTDNALYVTGGGTVNSCYIKGDLYVTGDIDGGNKGRLAARFAAADASPKPFDMQHPTKGEGNRLCYACIEGPEVGVYFRGRLRRGKEIFLPNYWKGLVHIQSITVQLQPIGAHQDIIIKRWDDEKIYLQSNGGMPIDCFYHVYAERKDCNPLVVEYQGDGWEDYPDKDYKDPNFSGPPNIITV